MFHKHEKNFFKKIKISLLIKKNMTIKNTKSKIKNRSKNGQSMKIGGRKKMKRRGQWSQTLIG